MIGNKNWHLFYNYITMQQFVEFNVFNIDSRLLYGGQSTN